MIIYTKEIPPTKNISVVSKYYGEDLQFDLVEEDNATLLIRRDNFDEPITSTILLLIIDKFKTINPAGCIVLTDIPKEEIDGLDKVIDMLELPYKELDDYPHEMQESWKSQFATIHSFGVLLNIPEWENIMAGKEEVGKMVISAIGGSIISPIPEKDKEIERLDSIYKTLDVDLVEFVYLPNELVAIVDEEGLLKSDNFIIQYDHKDKRVPSLHLAGPVIFAKTHQDILVPLFYKVDDEALQYISDFNMKMFGMTN